MDLKAFIENEINKKIEKDKFSQIDSLSGSNALLYDGYNFETEDTDHCPRIALLRRSGDIQEKRQVKSFLSNMHGRLFEDLLRNTILSNSSLKFIQEEEAKITIYDQFNNIILTARPDLIIKYEENNYAVEIKTIQSNRTAYQVFIKDKPKLNALIQLAIYMFGHNIETGYILYATTTWHSGFAGRQKWNVEPQLKVFNITHNKEDDFFYCNGIKTIVSSEKLLHGGIRFLGLIKDDLVPEKPLWRDVYGNTIPYEGCTYCSFKNICDGRIDSLKEFFSLSREIINE